MRPFCCLWTISAKVVTAEPPSAQNVCKVAAAWTCYNIHRGGPSRESEPRATARLSFRQVSTSAVFPSNVALCVRATRCV